MLIRHLEAIYLRCDFHCEANIGSHLGSLLPTTSKKAFQEKFGVRSSPQVGGQVSFPIHHALDGRLGYIIFSAVLCPRWESYKR